MKKYLLILGLLCLTGTAGYIIFSKEYEKACLLFLLGAICVAFSELQDSNLKK